MDISKIKELEAALRNHELGSPDPDPDPGPEGSPAYSDIYSITVEADYAGRTRAKVRSRDNPGAIAWKSKWPDGTEFLYVKVNDITYMCIGTGGLTDGR